MSLKSVGIMSSVHWYFWILQDVWWNDIDNFWIFLNSLIQTVNHGFYYKQDCKLDLFFMLNIQKDQNLIWVAVDITLQLFSHFRYLEMKRMFCFKLWT